MKFTLIRDLTPCNLVHRCQYTWGTCCLHLQGIFLLWKWRHCMAQHHRRV